MMNMNDGGELVFISSTFHTKPQRLFTEPNMEHMWISGVYVWGAWYIWLCSIWVRMCAPLRVCVCVSIKNERPACANERWRETVIETLGRTWDGSGGVGGGQQMEKKHTPCTLDFHHGSKHVSPRDTAGGEGALFSQVSCCAVTLKNTKDLWVNDRSVLFGFAWKWKFSFFLFKTSLTSQLVWHRSLRPSRFCCYIHFSLCCMNLKWNIEHVDSLVETLIYRSCKVELFRSKNKDTLISMKTC